MRNNPLYGQGKSSHMTQKEAEALVGGRKSIIHETLNKFPELEAEISILRDAMGLSRTKSVEDAEVRLEQARKAHPALAARMDKLIDKVHALSYKVEAGYASRFGKYIAGVGFIAKDEAWTDMIAWALKGLTLQKPEHSCYHKFAEECELSQNTTPHVLLVQHDWASALANATDLATACEFRVPMPKSCFEFRVSGRKVLFITATDDDCILDLHHGAYMIIVETPFGWCPAHLDEDSVLDRESGEHQALHAICKLVTEQARAISVCLEAEAVELEVERAPYKMNRLREKRGRLPILDHHIVKLSNRVRRTALPPELRDGEKRTSPRLHFRRGHYRHYPKHKVWIKWMLVGNPDLGFIDKEYRL